MQQLEQIRAIVRHFITILILQGILFIVLGVLTLVYPPFLLLLFFVMFVAIGISLLMLAWKLWSFWRRLPEFLRK